VSMKLHDRSTQQNTWCVRISQRSGWSIIIKPAHGDVSTPPPILECGAHHVDTREFWWCTWSDTCNNRVVTACHPHITAQGLSRRGLHVWCLKLTHPLLVLGPTGGVAAHTVLPRSTRERERERERGMDNEAAATKAPPRLPSAAPPAAERSA
jgi:hypothetical protein